MIMNTCLISQNNFCFDSLQIKEIRRKVDNGIIYKQLVDSLTDELHIVYRVVKNLQVDIGIEKEKNVNCERAMTLYAANESLYVANEKIYKKEITKHKNQKRIIVGVIGILGIISIFAL